MQIVIHSSKTMRMPTDAPQPLGVPQLLPQARQLAALFADVPVASIAKLMSVSDVKAAEVQAFYTMWSAEPQRPIAAIDAFVGDIYSGLQVPLWSTEDRIYAQQHLLILSGLYGALRACDGIMPYRLEMGYKLPDGGSLYRFWGDAIAAVVPHGQVIVNLSAVEYTKALLPYFDSVVVAPKFLTISPKTGQPIFVTVHSKIARGAFARWLIHHRIDDVAKLTTFAELGYRYDTALSTPDQPVFVCQQFGGLGLSVRGAAQR